MIAPTMLTVRLCAQAIHRSPAFVRELIHTGRLKGIRLSEHGQWLVPAESLSRLLGLAVEENRPERLRR
jgi:hypothetical protein